jgi:hypothetical protein
MVTGQLKEPCGNPRIDTLLPKACLHELTRIRYPVRTYDSSEDASEAFIDGGGI